MLQKYFYPNSKKAQRYQECQGQLTLYRFRKTSQIQMPERIRPQCTFVMPIPREKNLQSVMGFSNVFENFFIHETMLSAIFHKFASFSSRRFPKPQISTVFRRAQKNTSKISRKSTENRMTKRMSFYKK